MRRCVLLGGCLVALCATRPTTAQETVSPPEQPMVTVPAAVEPDGEPSMRLKALPDKLEDAVGTWDLSIQGVNRRCTLTLSIENGRNGRILRFPAGCRRALPILGKVAGWFYLETGIRLVDENIRPVLLFSARPDRGSLVATVDTGETYNFVPLQTVGMLSAPAAQVGQGGTLSGSVNDAFPAIPDVAGARSIPGAEPVLPTGTLQPSDGRTRSDSNPVPGIYALDRFAEKDVCHIELSATRVGSRSEKDLSQARIMPGCRDTGVTVFDPITWYFANGHMTLKAKKGHAINLVPTRDGAWRRDPDTGVAFVLRKVQ